MKVFINTRCLKEKKYTLSVLLEEFLGQEADFVACNDAETDQWVKIVLNNNRCLFIKDAFFSNFPNENYLDKGNIPESVSFSDYNLLKKSVPIIYGDQTIERKEESIHLGLDLVASSFFMLSRWEEVVIHQKDKHERFPYNASLAFKCGFLSRPIVNEYVELLWQLLKGLDPSLKRSEKTFKHVVTHDVDILRFIHNPYRFLLGSIKTMFTHSFDQGVFRLKKWRDKVLKGQRDIWDTFDYFMDISESLNIKSNFFFIADGLTSKDKHYDITKPLAQKLLKKIDDRGHVIGIHPSYMAYNNEGQFKHELDKLQSFTNQKIEIGRHHYLRFEMPTTWQIWENNGMKWDSTLGYAAMPGFRCGTCYEYSVFNVNTRQHLQLKEMPLIVMDGTLVDYLKLKPSEAMDHIKDLKNQTVLYKGNFVFLWHNSSFGGARWENYNDVYINSLNA